MTQTTFLSNIRWKRRCAQATAALALWLGVSFLVTYCATRRAHGLFPEPPPAISWGQIEPTRLTTTDGEELGAWFVKGQPAKPAVLLLHGHRGCRANCLEQAEIFARAGCSVLLVTLRAHGDSTGDFNDVGYGSRPDVLAAASWLEQRVPGQPLVIYGQSMGAAAATFSAGDLGMRVHGYVLESPYQDLRTAVWNRAETNLPPGVSVIAYAGLAASATLILPELDRMSPLEAAAAMPPSIPVLLLAGAADRHARPEEAQAIAERIGPSCQLVMFADAEHGGLSRADAPKYRQTLLDFLKRVPLTVRPLAK